MNPQLPVKVNSALLYGMQQYVHITRLFNASHITWCLRCPPHPTHPNPPSPLAVTIGNYTAAFVERDPPQAEGTQSVRPGAGLGGLAQNADESAEPSCDSQKLNEEIEGEE